MGIPGHWVFQGNGCSSAQGFPGKWVFQCTGCFREMGVPVQRVFQGNGYSSAQGVSEKWVFQGTECARALSFPGIWVFQCTGYSRKMGVPGHWMFQGIECSWALSVPAQWVLRYFVITTEFSRALSVPWLSQATEQGTECSLIVPSHWAGHWVFPDRSKPLSRALSVPWSFQATECSGTYVYVCDGSSCRSYRILCWRGIEKEGGLLNCLWFQCERTDTACSPSLSVSGKHNLLLYSLWSQWEHMTCCLYLCVLGQNWQIERGKYDSLESKWDICP